MIFVVDRNKRPLMPCSEKRARLLLQCGRAVVHRPQPFTIRLKDRLLAHSVLQPVGAKLDPGSEVTGLAIVREDQTLRGPAHHALHLAEIMHRGNQIHLQMGRRARYRRRRRSANLRYRAPRFCNRRRPEAWLPPSLRSRVGNVVNIMRQYARLASLTWADLEFNRFDVQKLQNPEIRGIEYQRGELFGYEVREYLLEKWNRRCAYCKAQDVPLQIEHIVPKSRGGSDRISNLVLACQRCNAAKGNCTAAEFGHSQLHAQALAPLRAASAINATRGAVLRALRESGLFVRTWTGGRTKWNRTRLGVRKSHAIDALCVGNVEAVSRSAMVVLSVTAVGRGRRRRTNVNAFGFPRGYLMRCKRVHGFQTGDLVYANVHRGKHIGMHVGRVAVRASGSFRIGHADGISWRYCRILWRANGYTYQSTGGTVAGRQAPNPGSHPIWWKYNEDA